MGFSLKKVAEELLHGSLSGLSMVIICHPVDTLKTRKQIETFKYNQMIMRMIRKEGILSFYKGVLSPMISMPMFKSVIFCAYKLTLVEFENNKSFNNNRDIQVGVAGFVSGFLNSFVCGPKDLFKVKLQVQKGKKNLYYTSYWDIMKKIYKVSGYRAVFQGTAATLWRDSISYPVSFVVYERMLRYFGKGDRNNTNNMHQFLAGAMSGTVSWFVIFPFDVVKSRIQSYELKERVKLFNRFQIYRELKRIYRQNGINGLFHGMSIYFVRSFFGNGIAFLVWNWCQKNLKLT
jgi:solute carrier family 25 carnitine/acylcarnitine transporter 20/29